MKAFVLMLAMAGACFGQISVEEAKRRLAERQSQRGAQPEQPAATRPTPMDPAQLYAEALAAMKLAQWGKASPLFEQAFKATPNPDRAMVLNRVLLDLKGRQNMMRGAKDAAAYLSAKPDPDEAAVDLLGACLQTAGKNSSAMKTELYKTADQQLATSVAALEATKPGQKKWGSQWLGGKEFESIQKQMTAVKKDIAQAEADANRAKSAVELKRAEVARYDVVQRNAHYHRDRVHGSIDTCSECRAIRDRQANFNSVAAERDVEAASR